MLSQVSVTAAECLYSVTFVARKSDSHFNILGNLVMKSRAPVKLF